MPDTSCNTRLDISLRVIYKNVDIPSNPNKIIDDLQWNFTDEFTNGIGTKKVNLQYHNQLVMAAGTIHTINLDSWLDAFTLSQNFDAIKCVIIQNENTDYGFVLFDFLDKAERFSLGPGGFYVMWEPQGQGLELSMSESGSTPEGTLQLTNSSPETTTVSVYVIGTHEETSSGGVESYTTDPPVA